jgi:hypothetical protein
VTESARSRHGFGAKACNACCIGPDRLTGLHKSWEGRAVGDGPAEHEGDVPDANPRRPGSAPLRELGDRDAGRPGGHQADRRRGDPAARRHGRRERPRGVPLRALAGHGHVPRRRLVVVPHVRPQPPGRVAGGVQEPLPRPARRVLRAPQGHHHRLLLPSHPRGGRADRHRPRRRRPRGRAGGRAEGPAARGHRRDARADGDRVGEQRPRRPARRRPRLAPAPRPRVRRLVLAPPAPGRPAHLRSRSRRELGDPHRADLRRPRGLEGQGDPLPVPAPALQGARVPHPAAAQDLPADDLRRDHDPCSARSTTASSSATPKACR